MVEIPAHTSMPHYLQTASRWPCRSNSEHYLRGNDSGLGEMPVLALETGLLLGKEFQGLE